ncbi:hypothetical protein [Kitasatospora sp. McL0602]|uniref:hypothetical protein n=1 Tax=Kitasatospora sp. McL0602 TaxID=3439530 RepID=UPI003F8BDA4C
MSAFAEQLPELILGLSFSTPMDIDFYSQGVERSLRFGWHGEKVTIECVSRTSWRPSPETEVADRSHLTASPEDQRRLLLESSGITALSTSEAEHQPSLQDETSHVLGIKPLMSAVAVAPEAAPGTVGAHWLTW